MVRSEYFLSYHNLDNTSSVRDWKTRISTYFSIQSMKTVISGLALEATLLDDIVVNLQINFICALNPAFHFLLLIVSNEDEARYLDLWLSL